MKTLQIITELFFITILPTTAIADTQMDTDPFATGSQFDSKPLDEHQQDEQDMTELWTTCIVIVACLLIARIAFQIVKKRMKKSN